MNPSNEKIRFDELSAGHAFGDLDLAEIAELDSLISQLGEVPDSALELLATTLDIQALGSPPEALPPHLVARLEKLAMELAAPSPENLIQPAVPAWKKWAISPVTGWAAAAAVLTFFFTTDSQPPALAPAQAELRLRNQATDLMERKFAGIGDFKQAAGHVIWSDQAQQGYMTLSGLPVNDPTKSQYQLWVVDPTRDADAPVDGGVFDIPSDGSTIVVPIAAKLLLSKPQAFVITLEQPGGVVKSKQEKVVALAKS